MKLKPCPFCGAAGEVKYDSDDLAASVGCTGCHMETDWYSTYPAPDFAKAAWNRRYEEDKYPKCDHEHNSDCRGKL